MSRPSSLPGFVNPDGSDVCIPLSNSRACDAWSSVSPYLDLSALARGGNVVTSDSLVYDVNTFDDWTIGSAVITREGAKGYLSGLLRAGGCSNLQISAQEPSPRYARSFICSRAILIDSTPISRDSMRWNATSNTGGGCEGNLTRRPFPLCRGQCEALMDSMMTLMADRQACPATDLSLLPLIKPALYKICTDMYGANAPTNGPCVQGVSDEVVTCGFGTAKIAEAVQYCGRQPTDPCCSSNVIIAAASLLPSRSATQSSPIATTTTAPISVASESAHGSDTPKTGLIIGLILSSLFLLVLGIVVVILVGRRYGYSVRSLLVKMTFGLVPRKEEDDVLMGFGTGSMQRLRRPTLTPAAAIMESSAPPMSYADGAGGGNRSGVPNAVWQVAGTMEREGLVGQDGGQYVTGVSFGSGSRERSMSTPPRMSRQGSRGSRESQRKGMESLGRASTRSTGTLVLRKGESFGPETFKTKWHGVTNYLPRLPDEIEIFPGDLITLSTFYNDGWAYGRNERTLRDGYLPLSAVVATGEDSLTRPSVAMTASTSETRSTTSRHGKFATLPPSEAMHHEYPLPNRYPTK